MGEYDELMKRLKNLSDLQQTAELIPGIIGVSVEAFQAIKAIATDASDAIEGLIPAADVVPVVRCQDCKYREEDDFCTGRGWPDQLVADDGYCDKGKRKDGDGE